MTCNLTKTKNTTNKIITWELHKNIEHRQQNTHTSTKGNKKSIFKVSFDLISPLYKPEQKNQSNNSFFFLIDIQQSYIKTTKSREP